MTNRVATACHPGSPKQIILHPSRAICARCDLHLLLGRYFFPDLLAMRVMKRNAANDKRDRRNNDWVVEAIEWIPGRGWNPDADQWHKPSEHAVAYVIRQ